MCRVELPAKKVAYKNGSSFACGLLPLSAVSLFMQETFILPGVMRLQSAFDSYRETALSKLAGESLQACRLRKLEEWFCHLTFDELDINVSEGGFNVDCEDCWVLGASRAGVTH
ncbi:MAG: hypothetical protein ACI8WM_002669 [Burkholderiaceae bacterium]|jgi:hypothetical protein